jgi:hypothetical protein
MIMVLGPHKKKAEARAERAADRSHAEANAAADADQDRQAAPAQQSADAEDGRLRPDLIVKLPGNRQIVVDSKAPIAAYMDAHEATSDELRRAYNKQLSQDRRGLQEGRYKSS